MDSSNPDPNFSDAKNTTSHSLNYDLNNTNAYNPNSNNANNFDPYSVPGNKSSSDCISYTPSPLEIILPSPVVISTLCVSTDKTSLFITSLIRLFFYIVLYHILSEIMDLNAYKEIQYVLLVVIAVNIIYLGLVVSKSTVFSMGASRSMFETTEFKKSGVNPTPPKK
jgi:hypothetical protein